MIMLCAKSYLDSIPLWWHYRSTPSEEYYNITELRKGLCFYPELRRNTSIGNEIRLDKVINVVSYNVDGYYVYSC